MTQNIGDEQMPGTEPRKPEKETMPNVGNAGLMTQNIVNE